MSIIHFEEIRQSIQVKGICQKCSKRRSRTVSAGMTVNPFNKNPDGTVRTRSEIYNAVNEKLRVSTDKMKENFICKSCFDALPWPQEWPEKKGVSNAKT